MTSADATAPAPTILLIPGYWLGAWAWDDVLPHLIDSGLSARAVTLPGLDEHDRGRGRRTLDEQTAALDALVTAAPSGVVLVAHSGATGPVSRVLDQRPDAIRRVVWVDSGPAAPDSAFAPDLPADVTELPLPDFATLGAQASLTGLDDAHLARFRARAVPQPAGVARARVRLSNEARWAIPTTLVCCSLPSAQVLELAAAGHPMFAEVARLLHVDVVDLPTGHWPMWSAPAALAEIIRAAATA